VFFSFPVARSQRWIEAADGSPRKAAKVLPSGLSAKPHIFLPVVKRCFPVAASNTRPGSPGMMTHFPSLLKSYFLWKPSPCRENHGKGKFPAPLTRVAVSLPVARFHSFTVPSVLAVSNALPSGLNRTVSTPKEACPLSVRRGVPAR